jgi:hypothetical protein
MVQTYHSILLHMHSVITTPAGVCLSLVTSYIQQLDTQMHKMMQEKHRRSEEVKADQAAVNKIEETMQVHIQPCLVRTLQVHGLQHELCFTTAAFCVVAGAPRLSRSVRSLLQFMHKENVS